jgi:hypothetical protein
MMMMHSCRSRYNFFLVSCFLLFSSRHNHVSGYAAWLKCYIELDESEVIMHHYVVPSEEAREQVTIEVQPVGRGGGDDDDSEQEGEWFSSSDNYYVLPEEYSKFPVATLNIRLNVPESLRDVQYVMEVKGNGTKFVDRGNVCDGKRSSSPKHYDPVTLQIPMMDDQSNNNNNNEPVELIAGWAAGMSAVSLTKKLVIQRAAASSTRTNEEL